MNWLLRAARMIRQAAKEKDVTSLELTGLSREARAVLSALEDYCRVHRLDLRQVLSGLRSALHLAANERIGLYPANRHGSGEFTHEGQVFASDELAVESIKLRPGEPHAFGSDSIAIDRILVATAQPPDPQLHIALDLALALAGGSGVTEGQRIRLPFVQSSPRVFARAFSEKNIYSRASGLCRLTPEQLEQTLNIAIVTEARRFVDRKYLFARGLELQSRWLVVEHVSDPVNQISIEEARSRFQNAEVAAGDLFAEPVEIEKEWPSFAAPLLELIDVAGFTADARRLGNFDFAALVARRKLDAMPAAPETLSSRLRSFGITNAWRLFNSDGPEVYRVVVASQDAFGLWRSLSDAASEIGYFPVVLGGDREVEDLDGHWTARIAQNEELDEEETSYKLRQDRFGSNSPQEVLGQLGELDPVKLLNGEDNHLEIPHGDWPGSPQEVPNRSRLVAGDWTHIALVPARYPWEVSAFLPFFTGEAYPDQAELVSVARYYHEKYGALVFGMTSDAEVELWVPRSPTSKEDALALASEHFFLCPEGVVTDSVEAYAARLMQTNFWRFWWD